MVRSSTESEKRKMRALWTHWLHRIHRNVPPGVRTVLGVLLIVGGVFGFLPVLGFWMIPLGIAVVAMDLRPLGADGATSGIRVHLKWDHLRCRS